MPKRKKPDIAGWLKTVLSVKYLLLKNWEGGEEQRTVPAWESNVKSGDVEDVG